MKFEIIIIISMFILFIAAIIWIDRRNQQRYDKSRAFYGDESEEWRLNGIKAPAEMVSMMLGKFGVQMQQSVETDESGKIIHNFVTVSARNLQNM